MKMHKIVFSLIGCLSLALNATAANIEVNISETNPGEYAVVASVEPEGGDVLGIAGFSFDVVGTPNTGVSFMQNVLGGFEIASGGSIGFGTPISGPVGDFFSVGNNQATSAGTAEIMGVGVMPIMRETLPTATNLGVPALLGTISGPAGLTRDNFANVQLSLFPEGFSGLSNGATVGAREGDTGFAFTFGADTMVDPVLVGTPAPGDGPISLQAAFQQFGQIGTAGNAIVLSNGGDGELGEITTQILGPDASLFGALSNGLNVDLTLDNAAARQLAPNTALSATLVVSSANGGSLSYDLAANVPEPSTVALAGLALVGLVGFARRK